MVIQLRAAPRRRRDAWRAAATALLLTGLVAACQTPPPPPPLVADASGADRARLERVGGALVIGAADLCKGTIGTRTHADTSGGKSKGPLPAECAITFREVPRDGVGVAAIGDEILVSAGMLRFARDDSDLAVVLAHRMAHLIAEHAARPGFGARLRDAVGFGPGPAPEPVYDAAHEYAADRVSLFLLARADFDPAAAPRFWRRMASLPPDADDWLIRHPITPERIERMDGIVAEIAVLRRAKQALVP
ncbi:MAG TPA: M48 family metalloprotease [Candidatus Sulfotelmatobacter sp.]|nr:M48 family metalloprotease [Candidatus Sulfotelmatobacter sp.]